ncbi:hypothetical protein AVEN_89116-1 [Araneus ventricosus]|uniref:Histone-lysine N-methyltransferase SETMAR n=1 Tax=Araneus ventricosus TaxID=182803 RepID=A0A4Y2B1N9_ARAVE|nr:hypothetical protein AVEN_89116-1 [Araneus ventricosus]
MQLQTRADAFENCDCARGMHARRAEKFSRFLWAKGLPAKDIHKESLSIHTENCLSRQVVYCNIVSKLQDAIRRKLPGLLTREILFHHDNARPHTYRLNE